MSSNNLFLFLISANQLSSVKKQLGVWIPWLQKEKGQLDCFDLMYTQIKHKTHLKVRVACEFSSIEDLIYKLEKSHWIDLKSSLKVNPMWAKEVDLWLNHKEADWANLFLLYRLTPNRIQTPEYVFNLESTNHKKFSNITEKTISKNTSLLYGEPVWQPSSIEHPVELDRTKKYHVILPEELRSLWNQLDTSFFDSHYYIKNGDYDELLESYLRVFEFIQNICRTQKEDPVVFVLLVSSSCGLSLSLFKGLLKTFAIEKQEAYYKIIHFDEFIGMQFSSLVEWIKSELNFLNTEVRNLGSQREILSYKTYQSILKVNETPLFKNQGVYWLVGGNGGIGKLLTQYCAQLQLDATFYVSGRSEQPHFFYEFQNQTCKLVYLKCDISDEESVNDARDQILAESGEITGIIHAAGIIQDCLIINKKLSDLSNVFLSKVKGTLNLDKATQDLKLEYFLLFSSEASLFGSLGQVDYSSANAYLDEFAKFREGLAFQKKRFGLTKVYNWSFWKEGGMQIPSFVIEQSEKELGLVPIETAEALRACQTVLNAEGRQFYVAQGDREKIEKKVLNISKSKGELVMKFSNRIKIKEYLEELFLNEFQLSAQILNDQSSFTEMGLESMQAIRAVNLLEKDFGSLPKTLLFDYPDFNSLLNYFEKKHSDFFGEAVSNTETASMESSFSKANDYQEPVLDSPKINAPPISSGKIAIIGMSGRFPKANNMNELWKVLTNAQDVITEIPKERWDHSKYYSGSGPATGKTTCKWGGFLDDISSFDPMFFKSSKDDADTLDPQERLVLQEVWHALEDAGISLDRSKGAFSRSVGVYAGSMYFDYALHNPSGELLEDQRILTVAPASIANQVSYFYNFSGPSLTLDTMCSSSITTLHLACNDLNSGECDMAVSAAVNLSVHPHKYLMLDRDFFLSKKGRCTSFGEGGDGYVPSEGVAVFILKRLEDAINDNDRIYGVVRSTSINHGAKSNGYFVPNSKSQSQLIEKNLRKANVSPKDIKYVEAHGTGTALGDPIEIEGLSKAFSSFGDQLLPSSCPIGSIKSNIGHCEAASGCAALAKVLLQFKNKQLVPSIHSKQLNSNINWNDIPFYVQQDNESWISNSEKPLIALISSFGAGGSNGSAIIEEYREESKKISDTSSNKFPKILLISALNMDRIQELIALYHGHISSHPNLNLKDLAYSSQVRRTHLKQRLAVVFDSYTDLLGKLSKLLSDIKNLPSGVYLHQQSDIEKLFKAFPGAEIVKGVDVEKVLKNQLWDWLAELWSMGTPINWIEYYRNLSAKLIDLPKYPFTKMQCWFGKDLKSHKGGLTSNLEEKVLDDNDLPYILKGNELFIEQHQIEGLKILPGAFLCLMFAQKGSRILNKKINLIENISWIQPTLFTGAHQEITISEKGGGSHVTLEAQLKSGLKVGEATLPKENNDISQLTQTLHPTFDDTAQTWDSDRFYAFYKEESFEYGPIFRVVDFITFSNRAFSAQITLKPFETDLDFTLFHPIALDAMFQATSVCVGNSNSQGPSYPFLLEEVTFRNFSGSKLNIYGVLRDSPVASPISTYDIEALDQQGTVVISLKGFKVKSALKVKKKEPELTKSPEKPIEQATFKNTNLLNEDSLEDLTISYIKSTLSELLQFDEQELDLDTEFEDFGMDSVKSINLLNQIEKNLGTLPKTLLFEQATIEALSRYLIDNKMDELNKLFSKEQPEADQVVQTVLEKSSGLEFIRFSAQTEKDLANHISQFMKDYKLNLMQYSTMAEWLMEILSIDSKLIDPDFFFDDMGIDPNHEMQLVDKIRSSCHIEIKPKDVRALQTPRLLVDFIVSNQVSNLPEIHFMKDVSENGALDGLVKIVFCASTTQKLIRLFEDFILKKPSPDIIRSTDANKEERLDIHLTNWLSKVEESYSSLESSSRTKSSSPEPSVEPASFENLFSIVDWKREKNWENQNKSENAYKILCVTDITNYYLEKENIKPLYEETLILKSGASYSAIEFNVLETYKVIQAVLKSKKNQNIRIHCICDHSEFYELAPLVGFFRTLHLEYPNCKGSLIDVQNFYESNKGELETLFQKNLSFPKSVGRVDLEKKALELPVLTSKPFPKASNDSSFPLFKEKSSYLITGGGGGIILSILKQIENFPKEGRIILVGRSKKGVQELNDLASKFSENFSIEYKECDITNFASCQALIDEINRSKYPLKGIVHAAGLLRDKLILNQNEVQIKEVLNPKIKGLINLDTLSYQCDLDYFMVFSSEAGLFGNVGQGAYSAANSYLDFFIEKRKKMVRYGIRKGISITINWPYLEEGGMRLPEEAISQMKTSYGVVPLQTSDVLNAMCLAIEKKCSHVFVAKATKSSILSNYLGHSEKVVASETSTSLNPKKEPSEEDIEKMSEEELFETLASKV